MYSWQRSTVVRMQVFDRRTLPALRLTNSWTGDHFVGKLPTVGQPTQDFMLSMSINE